MFSFQTQDKMMILVHTLAKMMGDVKQGKMAGLVFVLHQVLVVNVMVPLQAVQIAVKSVKEKMEAKSQVTATLEAVVAHLAEILVAVIAQVAAILVAILVAVMGRDIVEVEEEEDLHA